MELPDKAKIINLETEHEFNTKELACSISKQGVLWFTIHTGAVLQLSEEKYVEFVVLDKNVFLVVNSNAKAGYKINRSEQTRGDRHSNLFRVSAIEPKNFIFKHYKLKDQTNSFYLQKTNYELRGDSLYELLPKPKPIT